MSSRNRARVPVTLAQAFVELADTLVDDYDVVEVLDGLMQTCRALLPGDAVGMLLEDGNGELQRVASFNEEARLLELFQLQTREGPCFEAARSGQVMAVPDLAGRTDRWPRFAERAMSDGFHSVYAFPMRLRTASIGALNIFGTEIGALDEEAQAIAQALADVATIGILQQRSIHRTSLVAENLQRALDTRVVIEQAKGILAERAGLRVEDAFEVLRSYARTHHLKLGDVARAVIGPPHLADAVLGESHRPDERP